MLYRPSGQHMVQPVPQQQQAQQMDQGGHTNALQPPAQHMMQGMMGPATAQPLEQQSSGSGPVPMATATHMTPSPSADIDMDNVESSADSIVPSIALQVCPVSHEVMLVSLLRCCAGVAHFTMSSAGFYGLLFLLQVPDMCVV